MNLDCSHLSKRFIFSSVVYARYTPFLVDKGFGLLTYLPACLADALSELEMEADRDDDVLLIGVAVVVGTVIVRFEQARK